MLDQIDPVRDLVRRAYRVDSEPDLTAGLLDVVRRAEPPTEMPATGTVRRLDARRRRSGLAIVATFAAAFLVIVVAATVASRAPQRPEQPGQPGASSPVVAAGPKVLLSECAVDWKLTLNGRQFSVKGTNPACPPLPADQLVFVDAARGNGLIYEGDATVWPVTPVGGTGSTVQAPFTFTVEGWPGIAAGHYYEVWYVPPGTPLPHPGDDAMTVYDASYTLTYRFP